MKRRRAAGKAIPQAALTLPTPAAEHCSHDRAIVGLDAFFCPSCRQSIAATHPDYQTLLPRRSPRIQPNNEPYFYSPLIRHPLNPDSYSSTLALQEIGG